MKKNMFVFALGFICASVISVGATVIYKASSISFVPNNSNWNVNNVEDALNDIEKNYVPKNYVNEWTFDYTGNEQILTVPYTGIYKLEVWGAQGGSYDTTTYYGGYGAYSLGTIKLSKDDILYINIGGQGTYSESDNSITGGYNGGGSVTSTCGYSSSGGGATHIALKSGLLSNLSNSLSDVLIVAGGGGGASKSYNASGITLTGGNAGGIQGNNTINYSGSVGNDFYIYGGTQTTHNASDLYNYSGLKNSAGSFGQGGDTMGEGCYSSAGGSGYYGGTGGFGAGGGAGGSSYIGNSLLTNKSMYCYNCTSSTVESTKTVSNTCVNSSASEACSKMGNGYAKITLVSID